jgi:inward rectifier potassium channel
LQFVHFSSGNHTRTYGDAFFFSVQTMSTIGYGNLPPQSTYLNSVVFIEAWVALIVDALIVALTVGKISRPTYVFFFRNHFVTSGR